MKSKKIIQTLALALSLTTTFGLCSPNIANAKSIANSKKQMGISYNSSKLKITNESAKFKINKGNYTISYDIKKLDNETVQVNTITTNLNSNVKERHTAIYNRKNNSMLLDGKEVKITITKTYNAELANSTNSTNKFTHNDVSNWDPVYVGTQQISFSDIIATIGGVATVIGGVISGAALIGGTVARTTLASAIGNWASVVGLGSTFASAALNGDVYFDEYTTHGQVPDGGGGEQYAYRYENLGVEFSLLNHYFNKKFVSTGSWFFAGNPY